MARRKPFHSRQNDRSKLPDEAQTFRHPSDNQARFSSRSRVACSPAGRTEPAMCGGPIFACPNPRGRPRKTPEISDADVHYFKDTLVEQRRLSRHELLMHSMFEQAIKGESVLIQRKLFDRFEQLEETRAQADQYKELAAQAAFKKRPGVAQKHSAGG